MGSRRRLPCTSLFQLFSAAFPFYDFPLKFLFYSRESPFHHSHSYAIIGEFFSDQTSLGGPPPPLWYFFLTSDTFCLQSLISCRLPSFSFFFSIFPPGSPSIEFFFEDVVIPSLQPLQHLRRRSYPKGSRLGVFFSPRVFIFLN